MLWGYGGGAEGVCSVVCNGEDVGDGLFEGVCVGCGGEVGEHGVLHGFEEGRGVALAVFDAAYSEGVVGEGAVVAGEGADTGLFAGEKDDPAVVSFDVDANAGVLADESGKVVW